MCEININLHSEMPIYKQIMDQIKPGERLSSAQDLSARLNVNQGTVVRAYRELRKDGILQSRCRRGTTIIDFNNRHDQYIRTDWLSLQVNEFMKNILARGYSLAELKSEMAAQILNFTHKNNTMHSGANHSKVEKTLSS
jgi:GntR family transcriptional regulator